MGLVALAAGTRDSTYEYGPFGETLTLNGTAAEVDHPHFSTKYRDRETGLDYYGFRYYNSSMGN